MAKLARAPIASESCSPAAEIFPAASPCLRTLEQILADAADGAFVVDPRGIIIFWNRAAERLLGWSEQEVIGLACCEALASVDTKAFRLCGRDCRALTAGTVKGDAHRLEVQTRTKAGQVVWLDITACAAVPCVPMTMLMAVVTAKKIASFRM